MATRFTPSVVQLMTSDGSAVAASWSLYFYTTGTTTAKDTYSDSALTTANSNPVVADSAGRFGDIFLGSGTYRVILKDDSGTTIWDADPVSGTVGSSGAVSAKTAAYTVTVDDSTKLITVDASSTGLTVTLLASATAGDGFEVSVKKIDSSSNAVTVDGNGSETLDGSATYVLNDQYETVTLRCDASNMHVLSTRREPLVNDPSPQLAATLACVDKILNRPVIEDYGETINAIGDFGGGSQDIDLTSGNVASATISTAESTFTFSNPSASGVLCSLTIILTNGGSQTLNWPASVDWEAGSAPTLTSSGIDVLTFFTADAGTTWYGFLSGLDMQ